MTPSIRPVLALAWPAPWPPASARRRAAAGRRAVCGTRTGARGARSRRRLPPLRPPAPRAWVWPRATTTCRAMKPVLPARCPIASSPPAAEPGADPRGLESGGRDRRGQAGTGRCPPAGARRQPQHAAAVRLQRFLSSTSPGGRGRPAWQAAAVALACGTRRKHRLAIVPSSAVCTGWPPGTVRGGVPCCCCAC